MLLQPLVHLLLQRLAAATELAQAGHVRRRFGDEVERDVQVGARFVDWLVQQLLQQVVVTLPIRVVHVVALVACGRLSGRPDLVFLLEILSGRAGSRCGMLDVLRVGATALLLYVATALRAAQLHLRHAVEQATSLSPADSRKCERADLHNYPYHGRCYTQPYRAQWPETASGLTVVY